MKYAISICLIALMLVGCAKHPAQSDSMTSVEPPELVLLMSNMQRYLHKLDLSARARNPELISFYLHEVEEITEEIIDEVPEYDGHPIGRLAKSILEPRIEALEAAVEHDGDIEGGISELIAACNECHASTEHEFIVVAPASSNPFNQEFDIRSSDR